MLSTHEEATVVLGADGRDKVEKRFQRCQVLVRLSPQEQ